MSTRPTDAVSAAGATVVVWILGRRRGLALREMVRSTPFLGGVVGAFGLELAFARWPDRTTRLWRRPAVRAASPVVLVLATLLAGRHTTKAPFAATLGGLTGYFALLLGIASGLLPEPATWFERSRRAPRRRDGAAPSKRER